MKVAVYARNVRDSRHQEGFLRLVTALSERGHDIYCSASLEDFVHMNLDAKLKLHIFDYLQPGSDVDVLICVGGDGTILDTLNLVRDSRVPVLALNTGTGAC